MNLDPLMLYDRVHALSGCTGKGHTYIGAGVSGFRSYDQLVNDARRTQAHLVRAGLKPGDRLALVASDARAFVSAFLGGVLAGAVLVPMAPPPLGGRGQGYAPLIRQITRAADVSAVVMPESLLSVLDTAADAATLLTYEEFDIPVHGAPAPARLGPDDACFLQFTSGSTGDPKGVVVTYRNLAANCRAIMEHGVRITDDDVGVSWLPLHHDMGLIGKVLAPLTYPTDMVYISTPAFIKNPNLWLETISRFRGTISFAPNFAYAYAVKHFRRRPVDLRLDSLRVLGCGAEPINPEVLSEFEAVFGGCGLRRGVIAPSYGMAEATLAVTFGGPWRELVVDRHACEADRVAVVARGASRTSGLRLVSCGRPLPGHEIAIADQDGDRMRDGRVGEILVRGPSVTPGYFRNAAATVRAHVDGWLKTGDLGFLLDGELYVCGRVKDLIIVNGRNCAPQDIEWLVETLPGIRAGSVVACAVPGHETERVVVLAEVRGVEPSAGLDEDIRRLVSEELGIMVHEAIVLPPGSIPKTTSGKVQRAKARAAYLDDRFAEHRPRARAALSA